MRYLIMECHPAYAVALDARGRFLKVANLGYEVGQTVDDVIEMIAPDADGEGARAERETPRAAKVVPIEMQAKAPPQRKRTPQRLAAFASLLAACFCLAALGAWQFVLMPYGSVRVQINPSVQMLVNRLHRVVDMRGLNDEGKALMEGYTYRWKSVAEAADALVDAAMAQGYLRAGGTVVLGVESRNEAWRDETEARILRELRAHTGDAVAVMTEQEAGAEPVPEPTATPTPTPSPTPTASPTPTPTPRPSPTPTPTATEIVIAVPERTTPAQAPAAEDDDSGEDWDDNDEDWDDNDEDWDDNDDDWNDSDEDWNDSDWSAPYYEDDDDADDGDFQDDDGEDNDDDDEDDDD